MTKEYAALFKESHGPLLTLLNLRQRDYLFGNSGSKLMLVLGHTQNPEL
ncbi:hypothetical protein N9D28_00350 [Luminiphilus sp.]|jgi:hypothetical protein|nr:hypothetical protein [Luminiphilus sp.]